MSECTWEFHPNMDDLPPFKTRETSVETSKGVVKKVVPDHEKFLALTKCGKVILTYVRDNGQICFLAKGELPIAWMRIPPVEMTS